MKDGIFSNPFHQDKVWLHQNKLSALAESRLTAPVTVEVDLTDNACNQACVHCCFKSGEGRKMTQIKVNSLLMTLMELKGLGTMGVEFVGGGEPTVHKKILKKLLKKR